MIVDRLRRTCLTRSEAICLGVLCVSVSYLLVHRIFISPASYFDLQVYRAEGGVIRAGGDLYARIQAYNVDATYPPFAATCFVILSLVSIPTVEIAVFALNLVLVGYVVRCSLELADVPVAHRRAAMLLGCAVALWAEPVFTTMGYGQINLVVLSLVLRDFRPGNGVRLRGIGVGVATSLKVTPGIFVIYLLCTRRFKQAFVSVATFLVCIAISLSVDAHATWHFWTSDLFQSSRVGRLENAINQSIRGLATRITHSLAQTPTATAITAVVAVAGIVIAVQAHRRLGDGWGLCATAVTGFLVSPIAWSHHWVWCIPLVIVCWQRVRALAIAGLIVFTSFAVWYIPHTNHRELHLSVLQIVASGWYVYFGAAFLAAAAVLSRLRSAPDAAVDRAQVRRGPAPRAASGEFPAARRG
jgi:alpha-1,2-mannosyltransferase